MARQVNAQGGLIEMKTYPDVSRVELVNFLSAQAAEARVLALRRSKEGSVLGVAVELVVPSESFWGVNFQLKKTNTELFKLEQALKSGGIDLRLLKEFRDAVDYVRIAAGVVEEVRECQLHGRDTASVLALLAAERIRRAAHLCEALAADLDVGAATQRTQGLAELSQAVEQLYQRLKLISRYSQLEEELTPQNS